MCPNTPTNQVIPELEVEAHIVEFEDFLLPELTIEYVDELINGEHLSLFFPINYFTVGYFYDHIENYFLCANCCSERVQSYLASRILESADYDWTDEVYNRFQPRIQTFACSREGLPNVVLRERFFCNDCEKWPVIACVDTEDPFDYTSDDLFEHLTDILFQWQESNPNELTYLH